MYTAKVRFFKQITTVGFNFSKSVGCFVYRKGTIFQANHNKVPVKPSAHVVVLYTAKVRFFKQITTKDVAYYSLPTLFCIPQRYDFSSKSQPHHRGLIPPVVVLYTAKVRFFKQITTQYRIDTEKHGLFCIPQRYDFSSKSQQIRRTRKAQLVVLYTAKVRFFKQITTETPNTSF